MDNDEPFDLVGCNAYLRIAKADGTQFQGHECCSIDDSSIIIDTSVGNGNQILAVSGTNKCELHIEDQNGIGITTWNFNIYVEPRVHNGENISSYNSYDVLDNMINMEKDRIGNEQIRKNNEINRIENEETRKESETKRATAESERQLSEIERKKTFSTVVTSASISAFNASISEKNAYDSSLNAESWTHGNTGIRSGENTNNSKFWCQQSESNKNASETLLSDATKIMQDVNEKIIDLNQKLANSKFEISDDGELELEYESESYDFEINDEGELEYWIIQEDI